MKGSRRSVGPSDYWRWMSEVVEYDWEGGREPQVIYSGGRGASGNLLRLSVPQKKGKKGRKKDK